MFIALSMSSYSISVFSFPYLLFILYVSVQPLVVSAGDNRKIQLPEDKVTLYASTVPADTDSKYQNTVLFCFK